MAAIIKCKMCGGDLALTEGSTIATCEYCGTQQTVPSQDNEKKLTQFARADRLRRQCEFDKAAGVYESIVADFSQEAEAYWGLVLCKYGIEYVDDPRTGKKIPTCHRSSFESVMEDTNFDQTLENADAIARKVYREEAKRIEEIRKGILEVSNKEAPYDIFICYKETDEKGERTLDSVLAQDLYDALTGKGYRVFFSRITLEDKLGMAYEPYIFAALNSAKVMLAIGTDYEYFNAVWVKNEWSRFLKLMEKDKSKHLIPCYKGIDAYDMPKEFARLQAQDLGKMGAQQDILRNMEKFVPLKGSVTTVHDAPKVGLDLKVTNLLDQAYQAMDKKQWEMADALFAEVLKVSANTADRFLVEQNVQRAREQAQFQLRRKQAKKHNLILMGILAVLMLVSFFFGGSICTKYLSVYGQDLFGNDLPTETILLIGKGLHGASSVLLILSTLLAARFVGKVTGEKTAWNGLARTLSIIGMLIFAVVFALFYYLGKFELSADDAVKAWPICNWAFTIFATHFISFVGLFFRKKV